MSDSTKTASTWSPLRNGLFRALWLAVLISNVASWMQTVGAQWLLVSQPNASILVALAIKKVKVSSSAGGISPAWVRSLR